ncbi:response regulator, partial [Pseudomonas juntendi]|uniref:response regulator n=1 Tax=Pseudomonas juntendi TaxID=2666183 RepID=UPI001FFDD76B
YLPRDDTQVAAPPAHPQPPPPMPARTANLIMLVENQETMRLVISEILQEQGHDVHAFGDGQHAVAALHGGLQPDLLITDIGLPGGLVGQPLGNSLPDTTPVVFITGYTSEQPELPSARRFAVLHKPFELAQLSDLVARMLAGTPLSR